MNRPRDRASASGLLPRMEARPHRSGDTVSYRYHPAGGKPIALGTDRDDAIRRVLDMNGQSPHHGSLRWLWERWQESPRWKRLAPGTQADYGLAWRQIDPVLGALPARSISASRIARYVHIDREASPRRADIEKAVLSGMFKYGILLEVCGTNPTLGVEPRGSEPKDVIPETLAVEAFVRWLDTQSPQRRVMGFAARFAALSGARQAEFLPLVWPRVDWAAGVVRTTRAKQKGRKREKVTDVVAMSPALRGMLLELQGLGREGLFLFPTDENNQYTPRGFATMFQRVVRAALAAGVLTAEQRFNFHALRHHYVTTHKAVHGSLPNLHPNSAVTARVYDATTEEPRRAL